MQSPSKLSPSSQPLFLDASVVINLLAADCLECLAEALQRPICLETTVVNEVGYHPKTRKPAREALNELARKGAIQIVTCDEGELTEFMRLVGAPEPDDLDDGEAATLACARTKGSAAIDERKGRRVALRDYPHLAVYTTLDLIFSPQMVAMLGEERAVSVAQAAKTIGRMRVPREWQTFLAKVLQKALVNSVINDEPSGMDGV